MRKFPRWQRLAGLATVSSLAALAALATAVIAAPPASAASGPTVTAAWGSVSVPVGAATDKVYEIGLDAPTTLTYTITGGTDGISDVSFTDVLPSSVDATLYDGSSTAGTYTGCGSSWDDSANVPGVSTTITINGVSVAAGASCTVVFDVAGSVAGTGTDDISTVDYTDDVTSDADTLTATDAPTLTVLENPTVTFTTPKPNATYAYGQLVQAGYTCSETDSVYADAVCQEGYDNDGAEVDDGGYLDTLEAGSNALTVTATNAGFGESSPSVSYTVKPFVVKDVRSSAKKPLSYSVELPIAGRLVTKVLDGKKTVATLTTKVAKAGTVKPSLKLNKTGKRLLAAAKSGHLVAKVEVTFTPNVTAEENSAYWGNFSPEATTVTKTAVKLK